jgi:hypothetical protein
MYTSVAGVIGAGILATFMFAGKVGTRFRSM